MSWLESDPKTTNTVVEGNTLQMNFGLPTAQAVNFGRMPSSALRPTHGTGVQQLQLVDITEKERYVETFMWKVAEPVKVLHTLEIDLGFILDYFEKSKDMFQYLDFGELDFIIRPTVNLAYQGELWLAYDPSPSKDFTKDYYGFSLDENICRVSLLQRLEMNPTTTGEFRFTVPIILPFDFFLNPNLPDSKLTANQIALINYLKEYSFGRLLFFNASPLQTKDTSKRSLPYSISVTFRGFNYGATTF